MAHGSSISAKIFGRRWPAIVAGVIVSLSLSGASGPVDFITPIRLLSPVKNRSVEHPVPVKIVPVLSVTPGVAPIPHVEVELLHDLQPAAFIAPSPDEKKPRGISMVVTAYCACKICCGSHAKGLTASGKATTYNNGRFIAADTKVLPYGSKVIVPGYNDGKPVEVIDRGGAIRGNHIDVFMPTHQQAVEWGKKRLDVTVVE